MKRYLIGLVASCCIAAAIASLQGCGSSVSAQEAAPTPNYPQVADTSAATAGAAAFFSGYFAARSQHSVDGIMARFSDPRATFYDATVGWGFDNFAALKAIFAQIVPTWGVGGLSYPTRILGDETSAIVALTDTKELFGAEIRTLSAVDMKNGKIVRWVDYWDSRTIPASIDASLRLPPAQFATDFKESQVGESASVLMKSTANALQQALAAGDAQSAGALFSYDAVFEDMTLRTQVSGKAAITRYLARVIVQAPYGVGSPSIPRHVLGSDKGGGYEWRASQLSGGKNGIFALNLDASGAITRLTTVYDGRVVQSAVLQSLATLGVEP
ncbi:nuclear transport factor 2 family protein [Paraburkholderia hospita]|uniref:nuclear transport factor 2 family protein n=1 Tax=Paraburkholderia hospita TaxID=169430 RepID=UPI000271C736|nr:hypothetical protein [Paraburkholderia hospita]EUC18695.1 hypothetical protein PMI06_003320 [Burkholderia sp. BT03]SKC58979.1 hypothetical protein SAMN06266956_1012 [Paraburkholderia hospita]